MKPNFWANWEIPPPTNTQDQIGEKFWIEIEFSATTTNNDLGTVWIFETFSRGQRNKAR